MLAAETPQAARPLLNAIQMGPHTMLDEGIERCLDLIQKTAAINVVMIYSHTYHSDIRRPPQFLATDRSLPCPQFPRRRAFIQRQGACGPLIN